MTIEKTRPVLRSTPFCARACAGCDVRCAVATAIADYLWTELSRMLFAPAAPSSDRSDAIGTATDRWIKAREAAERVRLANPFAPLAAMKGAGR